MDFQTFTKKFLPLMQEKLPADKKLTIEKVVKNNGTGYSGLCFSSREKESVSPILYLENVYETLLCAPDFENAMAEAADRCLKAITRPRPAKLCGQTEPLFMNVREKIVFQLVAAENNAEYLARHPHRFFLDMAVLFAIHWEEENDFDGLATVTYDLMEKWQVTETDLFRAAVRNTPVEMGDSLRSMQEALGMETPLPAYILSNRQNHYGAAALLYSEKVGELAEKMNSDLYILPSSIHEVILLPKDGEKAASLQELVSSVNATEVRREEVLTNSVYCFERATRNIAICAGPRNS